MSSQDRKDKKVNWRERDHQIVSRLRQHVCCMRHFFDLFPSKQSAYRRLEKLSKRKEARLVGEIMVKDAGRPEKVFCNGWKPKWDQLRHETLLTDFLLHYPGADVLRGYLVNKKVRPDAEMTLDNIFYYVELDTGEESYAQVRRRQHKGYQGVEDIVLYVTLSDRRLKGLRQHSKGIASIALFTTLDAVSTDPRGEIWIDCDGGRASI